MIKRLTPFFVLVLFLSLTFFSSCSEDGEKIVEITVHDTVFVNVEVIPVTIDNITANPDSIAVGGSITLTAETTAQTGVGPLTLNWFATAGTFNQVSGDTVTWKAPDDANTYVVTVHATDGEKIGIGKRNIGVGMYAATADTFFVGADACSGCHNATHTGWATTGHATNAWAGLQTSSHAASYCNKCHTVDFDETPGNGGYDDAPIEKFQNVQCESCHGPSSFAHTGPTDIKPPVDISAENCTTCHSGSHHPFEGDWLASGHNFGADAAHGAPGRSSCNSCHSGNGFIEANDPDFTWEGEATGVTCAACHDPHNTTNPHQIRTLAPYESVVANETTTSIEVTGNGQLCVQCHHARRSADTQIDNGYGHFGPHGSPQGDMIAGVSAYEDLNDFDFSGFKTGHYLIKDACVTCHMHTAPYPNANTGHSFKAGVEACTDCHGTLTTVDDIIADSDFDGDGSIEGVQSEVMGLLDNLGAALVAAGLDTTGGGVIHGLEVTETDTLADGSQKPENVIFRKAGYNYVFVYQDGSYGLHNPDYTIQMLQQSLIFLENAVPGSAIRFTGELLNTHQKAVRM